MKKAFTLSEALITLAIIGVLAAILIPVIDNVKPDKDKITYKKAVYSMSSAVSNAMDSAVYTMAANTNAYFRDESIEESTFCESVADSLNTAGAVCCKSSGKTESSSCSYPSSYEHPNFKTTDGIRYWGLEGKFTSDDRTIYVDRDISSSELRHIAKVRGATGEEARGLKIQVRYDGKIMTGDSDEYDYENELIENSMQVSEGSYAERN